MIRLTLKEMEIEMEGEKIFEVDLGNIMAFDSHHAFPSQQSRVELVNDCLQKGTELVQAIADSLSTFPSTEDIDEPLVKLHPPTAKLPREKHFPRPKPPTKWETFAQKKGKASMSEWTHYRSFDIPSGWSARGGQGKNPYTLGEPCGSSSGSAISVAANLVTVSLGTETDEKFGRCNRFQQETLQIGES